VEWYPLGGVEDAIYELTRKGWSIFYVAQSDPSHGRLTLTVIYRRAKPQQETRRLMGAVSRMARMVNRTERLMEEIQDKEKENKEPGKEKG